MAKQLDLVQQVIDGQATWADVNAFRTSYYGIPEHLDTTSKGARLLRAYVENGWVAEPLEDVPSTEASVKTHVINGDGTQEHECVYDAEQVDVRDNNDILRVHGYDPARWEVVRAKTSYWDSQIGEGKTKTLCSSKLTVKPIASALDIEDIKQHFAGWLDGVSLAAPYTPKQYEFGGKCLVPCMFDVHFGKLASEDEVGENYDYHIAKERFLASIMSFIDRVQGQKFEQVVFPIGSDFFNSESDGFTTGKTKQDNDTRYGKMFKKGVETLIEAINMLADVAPVYVLFVPGNHDFYTSFYCACVLDAYYAHRGMDVTVDSSPTTRKYHSFGINLLGFTHGNEEGQRIFGLMQAEVPELWGNSICREWLVGHLHDEHVAEKNGVIVRRVPSITSSDAWLKKSGFCSSRKRSMALVYDKSYGLTDTYYCNF